jgi:hypothetical protein
VVWGGGQHACEEHFRRWLSNWGTACGFAAWLAGRGQGLAYYTVQRSLSKRDVEALDDTIDGAAKNGLATIILFPLVRSTKDLMKVLNVLNSGDRWTVQRVAWGKHERADCALIRIEWRTSGDMISSVGGFAPLAAMPATRRAPYVALAVWGGGRCNLHMHTRVAGAVGFIDQNPGFNAEEHKDVREKTEAAVGDVLSDPPEDMVHLRSVAFCVRKGVLTRHPLV